MLAYQSDAERNGATVALNSSMLSGTVSGMSALRGCLYPDCNLQVAICCMCGCIDLLLIYWASFCSVLRPRSVNTVEAGHSVVRYKENTANWRQQDRGG